jgi:hypothetical protein
LGSPEAEEALTSLPGVIQQLFMMGRKYQPDMEVKDWEKLVLEEVAAKSMEALKAFVTEDKGGAIPGPKEPSSATSGETPPTSIRCSSSLPTDTDGFEIIS